MSSPKIHSFDEIIEISDKIGDKRKLLLGNGFSCAWDKDIFSYSALLDKARESKEFKKEPEVAAMFKEFDTKDFERIIKVLKDGSKLVRVYHGDIKNKSISKKLLKHSEKLKKLLVYTITHNHPDKTVRVSEEEKSSCYNFLKRFDRIYTLNYDLLLYWTVLNFINEGKFEDGFHEGSPSDDYVVWEIGDEITAKLIYLHGALHLFDSETEIRKFTWSRTDKALKDQILEALKQDLFPIIVAEGTSKEKMEAILHNAYLSRGFSSFKKIGGQLFVFGHSFKNNDEHILTAIEEGKIEHLFISILKSEKGENKNQIFSRVSLMEVRRDTLRKKGSKIKSLNTYYFDADSAKVWGE